MVATADFQLTPRWSKLRYHRDQSALMRTEKRFVVVEAGRRSGKTEVLKRRGVQCALIDNPGYDDFLVVFAAPTHAQAKAIYWEDLKRLVPHKFLSRPPMETDLRLQLINGSAIEVVGMDKPKRIEGRIIDVGLYDEFAEYKQNAWAMTIRPCASTDGRPGRAFLYGVPRPSSQFAARAAEAMENASGEWDYFRWTSASVLPKEEIDSARRTLDPRSFAQEYEASRVTAAGRAYYTFDRREHLFDSLPYSTRHPLVVTMDFNVKYGAAAILQEHTLDNGSEMTDVIGEVAIMGDSNTRRVCRKVIEDWGSHQGEVEVDGDPSGGQRRTSADEATDWTEAREILGKHFGDRLTLVHKRGPPTQRDRVNAMNRRLKTADGAMHMRLVKGRTEKICNDLDNVTWIEGAAFELDKDSDKSITHWSDALGYYVERMFPINAHGITIEPY